MTDLDRLIEAVEAGGISTDLIMDAFGHGWDDVLVLAAYDGDLTAAKRLQDALLPGWSVEIVGPTTEDEWIVNLPDQDSAIAADPARAWLLAILRALKGQEKVK